ncbi:hypothetical protein QYE76_066263 [Lolium multiflorum]|uniref:Gag-pol polyprotein n=1 Tax=Lolium multiflorum TaxID=4521 RepID=A0AAD8SB83_LOLMU|nr:hypothetical protein QYE76_066263 [Lolium multiflorum]
MAARPRGARAAMWCGPLGRPPTPPFGLLIGFDLKTHGEKSKSPETLQRAATSRNSVAGARSLRSGTPPDGELEEIVTAITANASPSTSHVSPIHVESFIETACQHLLLLVGFDTLIYRKYYDTPPILVGHQDYFLAPLPGSEALLRSSLEFLFGKSTTTATVVDEAPGISMDEVRKKLFVMSLSGKAAHWYKLLKDGRSLDWKDIVPLFYSKFYPPSEIHKDRNRIYNFWPHDGESIAQAWGRLKSLMLKCPIHELPGNIIIDNFYARLSFQDKTLLDTACSGSFTRNKEEFKWDLLDRIQENTEGWENDKGRVSGINYNYECIETFMDTDEYRNISATYGLDSQVVANIYKAFASHFELPRKNFDKYHEPYKDKVDSPKGKCIEIKTVDHVLPEAYIEKTPFPAKMKEYSVITSVVNKSAKKPIEPEEQIKVEPAVAIVKDLVTENVEDGHIIFCEDASNIVSHPNKSMKASVHVLSVRIGDHCYYGLCDIGASISAIPYELYTEIMHEIGSCELEDIDVVIRLANRETISPIGIVRDVEVLCGKIKYPADFLVLGSAASKSCPIIFGRPFLNTCGAIIDCKKEKIVTKFAGESYEFNFSKFAKTPYKADLPNDDFRVEQCASIALAPSNPLQQHLENSESEVFREERDELDEIFLRQPILKHDLPVEDLGVTPPPKEDPVFDLKPLPDNLKYAYIDDKKTYHVIISAKLSDIEEERLLEILKKHRGAIGYTLDDLKGISPAICQHAINIEDGAKPVVEHQRRLIPKMKDVVRNEVLKLLEADMASPINFNQFLEKEKLKSNGSNFTDWFRHVRIFLNGGNLQYVLDAPLGDPPAETETDEVKNVYATRKTRYSQVQCAILCSLESDLQKRFEHHDPHELIKELKTIFETHAAVECYEASKHFFSCMMEEGSSISEHMLVMTGHAKKLSDLGIVIPNRLGINRVLQSLPPSYKNFVMNYNMQNMNKEFPELFGMLKAAEIEIKKEHQVLMVNKTTSFKKQGKSKGKFKKGGKKAATPPMKPKNGPKPDAECYYCKEKGHWKRNCSKYLADLKSGLVKKKKEACLMGKMTKTPFSGMMERATDLLEIIHTDVCGPMSVASRGGYRYVLTFTDDLSRYGYIYLMKHKSETFEKFKEFQSEVENQRNKKIKFLRSDRGGEYLSYEFGMHLKKCGILSQLTPPGTPQRNGVSERRNRTLLDMTAAFTLNRAPSKSVETTPYELWFNKKPKLSFLKVWGCEAYVKKLQPDKLEPKAEKCVFIGYPKETIGYTFYHRSEGKIFVAKNGTFLEKEFLTKEVTGRKVELDEIEESLLVDQSSAVPENVPVPPTPATEEANDNDHETSNETATEPRRSTRDRATPDWYDPCLNVMIVDNNDEDPATYEEAMMSPDSNKWQEAMKSEMGSMYDNKVWTLVELPDSRKAVENKWIFKRKTDADGNITVYKARLVAKGFRQIQGVDYDETFSPVAKLKSVRILLAIAAFFDYEIWQMDVKTAFLNGDIEEELYMGLLPPALSLDSFPCVEEAIRVTDEFCDQYRALRREVEILQEENQRLRRMLEYYSIPITRPPPPHLDNNESLRVLVQNCQTEKLKLKEILKKREKNPSPSPPKE